MAGNGNGAGAGLGGLTEQQLEDLFEAVGKPDIGNSAADWGNLGEDVAGSVSGGTSATSGPTPLSDLFTSLKTSWQGDGTNAFQNKVSQIVQWGTTFGTSLGNQAAIVDGTAGSVAGVLGNVANATQTSYTVYTGLKQDWTDFTNKAAGALNGLNGTSPVSGDVAEVPSTTTVNGMTLTLTGYNVSPVSMNERQGPSTWVAEYQDPSTGYAAAATGTSTVTMAGGLATLGPLSMKQVLMVPYQSDGAPQNGSNVSVNGTISPTDIDLAEKDQYMVDLRAYLGQVYDYYNQAASRFPAQQAPLSTTINKTDTPNPYTGSGVPGVSPTVPGGLTGGALPSLTGTSGGGGSGLPAVSTSGLPTGTANGLTAGGLPITGTNGLTGAGLPTVGTNGLTTPTSLASAPTTFPSLSGTSGLPGAGTAGLTTPALGTSGLGASGLGGTTGGGLPVTLPFTGSTLPASDFTGVPGTSGLVPAGSGMDGLGSAGGLGGTDGLGVDSPFGTAGTGGGLGANDGVLGANDGALGADSGLGAAALPAEEAALAARGAGGMPFMPMMPMGGMGGGSDNDRPRAAWLDEDEDVWATMTNPAPAVIRGHA